ncbi:MAG: DNA polymerase IV [Candidatus Hodarchaeota archaeon]
MMNRIILHCDLDCFFAAVEERDNPEYRGKPVIVGADPNKGKGRGVVSTCNYEARKYGLHSAMPISKAFQLCPHGIYLQPNFNKYKEASNKVMQILSSYSSKFQQVGIDEAYMELTGPNCSFGQARDIAKEIQKSIADQVGITLSIGCAPTKSIAKIASDYNKPSGITIIEPENIERFLSNLDITKIPGIGKKSKMYYMEKGIKVIGDIIKTPLYKMIEKFGKNGEWIWKVANGLDNRDVKDFHEERKSISKERTFYEDTEDLGVILSKLEEINDRIHKSITKNNIFYRTITLKIRLEGFLTFTRSKSLPFPIQNKKKVMEIIIDLLNEFTKLNKKIRLVGIKLSNLQKYTNFMQTSLIQFVKT